MENGYILDNINRGNVIDLEYDEDVIEDRAWRRFTKFIGYKGFIVLKNMAMF